MPRQPTICAIVPAAGRSSRMGQFKPLMKLGGKGVLERVIGSYIEAGVTDVRVVVGHRGEAVREMLRPLAVEVIDHPGYRQGMFSSVQRGVASLGESIDAFFIHPADIPLVRPDTVRRLIQAFSAAPAAVTRPVFDEQPGHPPLIRRDVAAAVVDHDGRDGLRGVLHQFEADTQRIAVADQGILLDLDTPDDAASLAARLAHRNCLSDKECRMLMAGVLQLSGTVVDHCRRVAQVATAIADAVNQAAGTLDSVLIRSAALVHDLAKGRPDHAAAAAALLNEMGFGDMAAVVAVHMEIMVVDDQPLDEAQIVHLADKLVADNALVDLERRFAASLKRYADDPEAVQAIVRRRDAARRIRGKVHKATERSLSDILEAAGLALENGPCAHC